MSGYPRTPPSASVSTQDTLLGTSGNFSIAKVIIVVKGLS